MILQKMTLRINDLKQCWNYSSWNVPIRAITLTNSCPTSAPDKRREGLTEVNNDNVFRE